jgi:5-methyltetrahydropteroyltriglutamate--homocysteine methyltransferase
LGPSLFNQASLDTFLLEHDGERAGDFRPLRFLPRHKTVVLDLVSSKSACPEDQDALLRRIDVAAHVVMLDQLGLSSQCGFASVAGGNA